jgi:hypothetical protein
MKYKIYYLLLLPLLTNAQINNLKIDSITHYLVFNYAVSLTNLSNDTICLITDFDTNIFACINEIQQTNSIPLFNSDFANSIQACDEDSTSINSNKIGLMYLNSFDGYKLIPNETVLLSFKLAPIVYKNDSKKSKHYNMYIPYFKNNVIYVDLFKNVNIPSYK